ncbi:MAG: YcgN family cysteine cluster protein [Pseudomonadota bacterium]
MSDPSLRPFFWREHALEELSRAEWEALCDGCGQCCLIKLEDEDSGEIAYTDIACRLFDDATCRCGNYALRFQLVKGCVRLSPETIHEDKNWMPRTCAYRLLAEGTSLPDWHYLISGSRDTVHEAGISVRDRTVPEYEIDEDDYEDRIIEGMN